MFFLLTEPAERGNWQMLVFLTSTTNGGRPVTTSTKGKKHICTNCETRYFDLGHVPAICPKCGTRDEEPKVKPASRSKPKPDPVEQPAPVSQDSEKKIVEDLEDIEVADDDDDTDDKLIEDTSELEDDDLPAVITINTDSENIGT